MVTLSPGPFGPVGGIGHMIAPQRSSAVCHSNSVSSSWALALLLHWTVPVKVCVRVCACSCACACVFVHACVCVLENGVNVENMPISSNTGPPLHLQSGIPGLQIEFPQARARSQMMWGMNETARAAYVRTERERGQNRNRKSLEKATGNMGIFSHRQCQCQCSLYSKDEAEVVRCLFFLLSKNQHEKEVTNNDLMIKLISSACVSKAWCSYFL